MWGHWGGIRHDRYFEDIDSGLVGVSGGQLGDQLLTARFTLGLLPLSTE
ncbi:MAG: hypothetical protein RQ971_01930 [Armatimonadota bacterium]|nr:hypothetical protein [Armatimonadota bacterium]